MLNKNECELSPEKAGTPTEQSANVQTGWMPIGLAPLYTPLTIKTERGREFAAIRDMWVYDEGDRDVCAWREVELGTAPRCWTDGICWSSNEDGVASDKPTFFLPPPPPEPTP